MMFSGAGFGGGFMVGFGVGFLSREIVIISMAVAKPITKSLVKASMMTYEKGKETLANMKETFEDMVAEVREGIEPAAESSGSGSKKSEALKAKHQKGLTQ